MGYKGMGYDGSPAAAGKVEWSWLLRGEKHGGGWFHTVPEWVHLSGLDS